MTTISLTRLGRLAWFAALPVCAAVAFVAAPLPSHLLDYRPVSSLRILDRQGNLLRELLSREDGRAIPIPAEAISGHLTQAFVAAEDHTFFTHPGLSPRGVARAFSANVRAGKIVQGGSTLTQQLARTLVPRPRTLVGKFAEALWALRLEAHLSKKEILSQYLNRVPFGSGTFGVEAAAQLYFGRSARDVSVAQAAALAALARGPSRYHPLRHLAALRKRQAWVLARMKMLGSLTETERDAAQNDPLDLTAFSAAFRAPHFVRFVVAHLSAWGLSGATEVRTSLDPTLQRSVETAVEEGVRALRARRVRHAAALVIDNATGEVLAYVGSGDFFDDEHAGQYDGVQEPRQPGSALKPFLYGEGFASGLTAATVLADTPAEFEGGHGPYHPHNYDRRAHGPVRAREALASSFNVPAVRLAQQLGSERVLRALHVAGFNSLRGSAAHYGLGLALGNGEVTLWELGRAYAGLAREGLLRPLVPVLEAHGPDGTSLPVKREHPSRRFLDASSAALVTDILSDPAARARAFGLENSLRFPFPAAAKTGTSKGFADNWTAGYTRERTVAVWAGNFERQPMLEVSGITGAAPLFHSAMLAAMGERKPAALRSVLLTSVPVCPLSGALAGPFCPQRVEERFAPGTEPRERCEMHRPRVEVAASPRCAEVQGSVVDVGPAYYAWAAHEGTRGFQSLCGTSGTSSSRQVQMLSPRPGDAFLLLEDLPQADQAVPVRLLAEASVGTLEVKLNGRPALVLQAPFEGRLPAVPGKYLLTVHRPGDAQPLAQVRYEVAER